MHLALLVIMREFQQFGVRIAGPYMLEYFAAAVIMIALLHLIRRRKRPCGAQRESTGLPMLVLIVVYRIRLHSLKLKLASSLDL